MRVRAILLSLALFSRAIAAQPQTGPPTPEAQFGFRPVDQKVARRYADKYPARPGISTIADRTLGGWRAVDKRWFDPKNGLMVGIEKTVGGPTSG